MICKWLGSMLAYQGLKPMTPSAGWYLAIYQLFHDVHQGTRVLTKSHVIQLTTDDIYIYICIYIYVCIYVYILYIYELSREDFLNIQLFCLTLKQFVAFHLQIHISFNSTSFNIIQQQQQQPQPQPPQQQQHSWGVSKKLPIPALKIIKSFQPGQKAGCCAAAATRSSWRACIWI